MSDTPADGGSVAVSVCVCTRRRPEGLKKLLESLAAATEPPGGMEIIVVENDEAAQTRSAVDSAISRFSHVPVGYFVEPRQNIALARNLSVAKARGAWLAFIDDDEVASKGWIVNLLSTARLNLCFPRRRTWDVVREGRTQFRMET